MQASADIQGYTELRTFRYERKFLVDEMPFHQVKALVKLHPLAFRETYPPRSVNNLYLDTTELDNYYDNVFGAQQRRKVRVRWYGEILGEIKRPMLEIKIKDGLVGTKHTHPLSNFFLDTRFCDRFFQQVVASLDLPIRVRSELRNLNVVLLNRYYRYYYATPDRRFRLTLDTRMTYYKINGIFENRFLHHQVDYRDMVVELKYEKEEELQANRVASFFPFRVTRNSKYVQGMERVYF